MMKRIKVIMANVLLVIIVLILSSCGESDSARSNRLSNEAAEKKQAAKEAKDNYNTLKNFADKIYAFI